MNSCRNFNLKNIFWRILKDTQEKHTDDVWESSSQCWSKNMSYLVKSWRVKIRGTSFFFFAYRAGFSIPYTRLWLVNSFSDHRRQTQTYLNPWAFTRQQWLRHVKLFTSAVHVRLNRLYQLIPTNWTSDLNRHSGPALEVRWGGTSNSLVVNVAHEDKPKKVRASPFKCM